MKEPMELVHSQGAADESGADRRGRRRQRVLKKALIVFNNSHFDDGLPNPRYIRHRRTADASRHRRLPKGISVEAA